MHVLGYASRIRLCLHTGDGRRIATVRPYRFCYGTLLLQEPSRGPLYIAKRGAGLEDFTSSPSLRGIVFLVWAHLLRPVSKHTLSTCHFYMSSVSVTHK